MAGQGLLDNSMILLYEVTYWRYTWLRSHQSHPAGHTYWP